MYICVSIWVRALAIYSPHFLSQVIIDLLSIELLSTGDAISPSSRANVARAQLTLRHGTSASIKLRPAGINAYTSVSVQYRYVIVVAARLHGCTATRLTGARATMCSRWLITAFLGTDIDEWSAGSRRGKE